MRCERCGEENPERARFCLACGAPLGTAPPQQERKLVSILFVDLVGSTGRADGADPEDVRDSLQAYHEAARSEIEAIGGNLEKFIGDAVMAVFGAPVSHGDDAERAVRAGLAVLGAVAGLGLEARAAVNTGEAVVAVGSQATSGQALAMGDVVNTASRLQSAAPNGGLVVGEETYRLTRQTFQFQRLSDVTAKGKSHAVALWLVLGTAPSPAARAETPMIGRDREVALLDTLWARSAGDRRTHLVTVLGPPGIGKSRLQREFSHRVQAAAATVLRGRCLPYGERAAYGAFAHLVRGAADVYENDSTDVAREKVLATVTELLPPGEIEETSRFLCILAGIGGDEPPLQRDFLFFAARRLLECMALRTPLLVIFEDLHWAEAGLLDLVEYLAVHVRDAPIMLIGLARPELLDRRAGWGSRLTAHTMVELEPLTEAESTELAEHLLSNTAGVRTAIAKLSEAAEGNPLFVEELTAALLDGRESEELPTSVRAAIASRLDALPPSARAVLLDGSVMGRSFWRGALMALGTRDDLDSSLAALEARDFIRRVPASRVRGDVEYSFKHVLIREVAYATLPRSLRRERHASAARYIEAAAGDTDDLASLLAHHWREAGEPGRAIEYLLRAARQAERGWALEEAVAHYDAALELAESEADRLRIRLARGAARSTLGDEEGAYGELEELIPKLSGRDRVEALLAWGWAAQWTERADAMVSGSQEALDLARSLGDRELEAVATAHLSQGLGMRGEDLDRALELGRRALEIWVPGTRAWNLANHRHMYGEQLYWTGHLAEVEELMDEALRAAGDPQSISARLRSASLRAINLSARGRYEEGLALFDQTIALARELGRPIYIHQNYSTLPLRDLFDHEEARRRSLECLEEAKDAPGFGMPRAMASTDLVFAELLARDAAAAENVWQELWREPKDLPDDWTRWLVRGRLAWARAAMELLADHPAEAVDWAHQAIELARPVHRVKYEAVSRTALGQALQRLGKPQEAAAELRQATALADRLGPAQQWPAWAALGEALYAAGDDAGAESAFTTAGRILNQVAGGLSAERSARFLAAPQVSEVLKHAPAPS